MERGSMRNKLDIKIRKPYVSRPTDITENEERKQKNLIEIQQFSSVIDYLCPTSIYEIDDNYRLYLHNTSKFAINLDSEYTS